MTQKTANRLKNLALALSTFIFCFLLLEGTLRLAGYGRVEIYEPHPRLFWRLKPNQDRFTKIGRKPIHINSLGTRGPEFTLEKPANTLRILFLGDSRTFGWGLAEEETHPELLRKMLQDKVGSSKKVEVINAGVNAWSYSQMEAYYEHFGQNYSPDFLVLNGANLWTQFSEKSSPEFVKKFMNRVRLKNFLRRFATYHYIVEVQLESVYQKYRTKFIPVDPQSDTLFKDQQQADPFAVFHDTIQKICTSALTNNTMPILFFTPVLTDIGTTNRTILESKIAIAKKLDIPLLDITSGLVDKKADMYLEADPVHLNAQGNKVAAQKLFELFVSILKLP